MERQPSFRDLPAATACHIPSFESIRVLLLHSLATECGKSSNSDESIEVVPDSCKSPVFLYCCPKLKKKGQTVFAV